MLHYKEQERARPHGRKEQTGTKVGDEGGIITGPFVLKRGDGKEQRLRGPSPSKVPVWMYVTRTLQKQIRFSLSLLLPVTGRTIGGHKMNQTGVIVVDSPNSISLFQL